MEIFHIIVISIAVILLIITLAVVGFIMKSNKTTKIGVYPALANNCPDFWLSSAPNVCIVPEKSRNKGRWTPDIINQAPRTFGYDASNGTIDFSHSGWSSTNKSSICAKNAWANTYSIAWDGVSNYTGCNT